MYTLFVTRGYPTDKYKTYGIFEFDQAKALVENGTKVVYISLDLRSIRRWRNWGISRDKISGIEMFYISIPFGRLNKKILEYFYIKSLKKLYSMVENEFGKPNVIHAHFVQYGYFSTVLKEEHKIPLVITEHSEMVNREVLDKYTRNIARKAYENADQLITVSPHLQNIIKKNFGIDSFYIPNMVDTEVFNYSSNKKDSEFFDFVSTGHLIKLKRMDLTIQSFSRAFKSNDNVRLTIFGHGAEEENLKKIIVDLNLGNKVFLMGQSSRIEIAEKLKNSDCFVLATQTETFGVAYIEALACGLPVIATRSGGPDIFVNEENGIMIDVDDENQLVEAMKNMYNNINLYDNEKIASDTKSQFSTEAIAKSIKRVYKNITSDKIK